MSEISDYWKPELKKERARADQAGTYARELLDENKRLNERIAKLESALRWCRPRLSKACYREDLDKAVPLPPATPLSEPRLVQSEAPRPSMGKEHQ